jgi:hypothetical protein
MGQCCAGCLSEVAVADRKSWESRWQLSTSKRPRLSAVTRSLRSSSDSALDPIHDARFASTAVSTVAFVNVILTDRLSNLCRRQHGHMVFTWLPQVWGRGSMPSSLCTSSVFLSFYWSFLARLGLGAALSVLQVPHFDILFPERQRVHVLHTTTAQQLHYGTKSKSWVVEKLLPWPPRI